MSDKRNFLVENFETIQQARTRKPRPLSYARIAKIISANGYKVSAQLVCAVCKEHEKLRTEGGIPALDGKATKLDKKAAKLGRTSTKLDGAAGALEGAATKSPRKRQRPK
jgi:hypothetical protein